MRDKKGFTLIELLIVVVIIGILAAVGVVAYNGYTNAAKRNTTISNHNTVKKFYQLMVTSCAGGIVEKFELKRSSTAKEIVYCPLNANANINSFEYHFMYEGFANAYGTTPRLVIKGCYETAWQKKNNHGCVSLTAPDDKTFKLTTYYLDQDKNSQSLTDTVTIE